MFCTNCEFEIQGEGREKCPICGGPLLDFSLLDSETQEEEQSTPEEKQTGSSEKPTEPPTYDLASLLNDDEGNEAEPEAPAAEELPIEDIGAHTFEKTGEEPGIDTSESNESTPFDLEGALTSDDEKQSQESERRQEEVQTFDFNTALNENDAQQSTEPEEPAQASPAPEHKPEPEPALEELSTEELLRRIAEEYKPTEEEVIAPPPEPQPVPTRSSRSISAIAALAVFALIAAIASVAYLTPQGKLHPVIDNLKTETEKKISEISHILIAKAEKQFAGKETPKSSAPPQKPQPDKTVKKIALYTPPPVQKEIPRVEEKPAATHKTNPASSEQKVTTELTQPLTDSEEETLPLPQKNSPPQITEEKEQAPSKPTEPKGTRKNTYSLHTGSFTTESIASAESERLIRMGFKSYIQKVSLENGQTWYRIKVGSFSTRKEAEAMQEELKQKAPHIKSYIMRKKVPSKAAVAGEVAEKPDEVAIINPAVSAHRKNAPAQDKPNVVEASPPVSETVTGEETPSSKDRVVLDAEQTAPEMNEVPEALQPVVEAPQETLDPAIETYSPEKAVALETEQTSPEMDRISDVPQAIAEVPQEMWDSEKETYSPEETVLSEEEVVMEMEYNPYTQEPIDAESNLEGSVSIETLPDQIPEQEDQVAVTIDLFPEMGVQEVVSTPVE